MKKFFISIISFMFIFGLLTGCSIETAKTHDARVLEESKNQAESISAAASAEIDSENTITVYLTVDCTDVIGKENLSTSALIGNGQWLTLKPIVVPLGSSVYDVLSYAHSLGYGIDFTEDNSIMNGYIVSINNLYQKECGGWSGWTYKVNGTSSPVSCTKKIVSDGDEVIWFFTTSS